MIRLSIKPRRKRWKSTRVATTHQKVSPFFGPITKFFAYPPLSTVDTLFAMK